MNLSRFLRSEIQNQLAGLRINILLLPQYKLPNVHSCPLTFSALTNTCFQNNMWTGITLGEFAISSVLVILCEPVNVETGNGNFSTFEAQRVYRWQ